MESHQLNKYSSQLSELMKSDAWVQEITGKADKYCQLYDIV